MFLQKDGTETKNWVEFTTTSRRPVTMFPVSTCWKTVMEHTHPTQRHPNTCSVVGRDW